NTVLRRADLQTKLHGKDLLAMGGEYTAELILSGLVRYLAAHAPDLPRDDAERLLGEIAQLKQQATDAFGRALPARPPNFYTGCPSFATFAPFSFGNSILGYGMSLASGAGVRSFSARRPVAIMGDGGFWHNGLLSGVSSALLNKGDGVLIIMKNGYTSATGTQ